MPERNSISSPSSIKQSSRAKGCVVHSPRWLASHIKNKVAAKISNLPKILVKYCIGKPLPKREGGRNVVIIGHLTQYILEKSWNLGKREHLQKIVILSSRMNVAPWRGSVWQIYYCVLRNTTKIDGGNKQIDYIWTSRRQAFGNVRPRRLSPDKRLWCWRQCIQQTECRLTGRE